MAKLAGHLECDMCHLAKLCYQVKDDLAVSVTSKIFSGFNYCRECIEAGAPTCGRCSRTCYLVPVTVKEFTMSDLCNRCSNPWS